VLRTVLAEHEPIAGETILTELGRTLRQKLGIPELQARDVFGFVRRHATIAVEASQLTVAVRDPSDIPILAAAIGDAADALVTGDKELQVLERVDRLPSVVPRGFWQLLKTTAGG
jgi:predicted nucleic acid-binding protein